MEIVLSSVGWVKRPFFMTGIPEISISRHTASRLERDKNFKLSLSKMSKPQKQSGSWL